MNTPPTLIRVVKGEIPFCSDSILGSKAVSYLSHNRLFTLLNPQVEEYLRIRGVTERLGETQINPDMSDYFAGRIQRINQEQGNKEVTSIIEEGQLNAACLIDSIGGNKMCGYGVTESLLALVKSKGGELTTYGGNIFLSTAGLMWLLGDDQEHRFCNPKSRLMLHIEYNGGTSIETDGEEIDDEISDVEKWTELLEFLTSRIPDTKQGTIHYQIAELEKEPSIEQREIWMCGEEIQDIGLGVTKNVGDLLENFMNSISCTSIDDLPQDVRSFFT